jgi:DNA-binding beta-propeller fold protein YncE
MRIITVMGALAMLAVAAAAQQPTYKRDVPDSLAKQAKVPEDSARKIAQAQVPKGVLNALEIEREKGKLIWSMEFKIPGKKGIEEVNVDAMTGKVISVGHEASGDVSLQGYHVTRKIPVGGEGGWDYLTVDTIGHRLYISRSTHVMVINTDNDGVAGDIPGQAGVHGIAIAQDLGRGFISNGRDSTVVIFDLKTLAALQRVNVKGRNPDAIMYEPVTKRVFAFNGGSATATAIDGATGAVIGLVPLSGKPEFAVHDGKGRVFVNIEDRNEIMVFDAKTLAIQAHWAVAPCEEASGLAIDRARAVLFTVCGNKLMSVVSTENGRVKASLPIGDGVDAAGFDPATLTAFASNGDGTMTIVQATVSGTYTVSATVPTQRGARTMALDERTHAVYTVSAEFGPAPEPTKENPRPRPPMVPGSFVIIVLEP